MNTVIRAWQAVAVALLLLIAPVAGQQRAPLPPALAPFVSVNAPIVALTHVRVVDGTGAPAGTDQTVIVEGERFGPIGPFASTTVPVGARVIDLSNHTVLPGLVGLHEHTYFGGVTRVTPMNLTAPLLYLAYGVTTAMTAGSMLPYHEVSLKRAVDEGRTPGPRFLIAGPYLDGNASRNPMSLKVGTPEAARRAVRYWSEEGATWIKFLAAETREELRAAIEEAHAHGSREPPCRTRYSRVERAASTAAEDDGVGTRAGRSGRTPRRGRRSLGNGRASRPWRHAQLRTAGAGGVHAGAGDRDHDAERRADSRRGAARRVDRDGEARGPDGRSGRPGTHTRGDLQRRHRLQGRRRIRFDRAARRGARHGRPQLTVLPA